MKISCIFLKTERKREHLQKKRNKINTYASIYTHALTQHWLCIVIVIGGPIVTNDTRHDVWRFRYIARIVVVRIYSF